MTLLMLFVAGVSLLVAWLHTRTLFDYLTTLDAEVSRPAAAHHAAAEVVSDAPESCTLNQYLYRPPALISPN